MSNKDKGGPAFPVHPDMAAQLGCVPSSSDAGMSLRDYFAAKAMQGIVPVLHRGIRPADIPVMCADAYAIADAMLKAREA